MPSLTILSLSHHQVAQLTYVIDERLKEAIKDTEREKALKDIAVATVEEKGIATETIEKRAQFVKKAQLAAENKLIEIEVKLGGTKLKLAKADSLNLAQANEIADLKAALKAYEEKWYNVGFTKAENFMEPIVHEARHHGFEEGWLVALQEMGVAEDSPQRNPKQIPYPAPFPLIQSQASAADEEDTPSLKKLV